MPGKLLAALPPLLALASGQTALKYVDNFNSDLGAGFPWTLFEEDLQNHPCLLKGAGAVSRSTGSFKKGKGSLLVSSNKEGNKTGSNHVLAQRKLGSEGLSGKFKYAALFYVNTTVLPETQTGPEMSVQSTRGVKLDSNGYAIRRTFIAGIQHVGNKHIANKWNIWAKNSAGGDVETAAWTPLPGAPNLDQNGWWQLILTLNYKANKYLNLKLKAPDKTVTKVNLKSFKIARENKFGDYAQGGFGITLESQNMFDCNSPRKFDAYYDNVIVKQKGAVVPVAPTFPTVPNNAVALGQSATLDLGNSNLQVWILVPPPKGDLTAAGGVLTYKATEVMSQVGIKFRACDTTTFLCGEGWWEVRVPAASP